MLCRSRFFFHSEFENKTRFSYAWPKMTYGSFFLMKGNDRRIPIYQIKWVTRESNRLINQGERYGAVIKALHTEKNMSELNIAQEDVRWHDYRRLHFKCPRCGWEFLKNGHTIIRYRHGCLRCLSALPSRLLSDQCLPPAAATGHGHVYSSNRQLRTLAESHPAIAASLWGGDGQADAVPAGVDEADAKEKWTQVAALAKSSSPAAPLETKWECSSCHKPYSMSVRARTGETLPTQAHIPALTTYLSDVCDTCRWSKLARLALQPSAVTTTGGKQSPKPPQFDISKGYLGLNIAVEARKTARQ